MLKGRCFVVGFGFFLNCLLVWCFFHTLGKQNLGLIGSLTTLVVLTNMKLKEGEACSNDQGFRVLSMCLSTSEKLQGNLRL